MCVDVHRLERARRRHADPRRRLALEGDLHDLAPVDAVAADGLAHAQVAEDRVRHALLGHGLAVLGHGDLHGRHHRCRLLARHDLRIGDLRLQGVDVLGGEGGDEIDLARLEGGHLGDGVLDHADDDAVEDRLPGHEVLVEAVHHQMPALHPLDELERPAPHHRAGLALLSVLEGELLGGGRRVEDQARAVRRRACGGRRRRAA